MTSLDLNAKDGAVICINSKITQKTISGFYHLQDGVASQGFEITTNAIEKVQKFSRKNAISGKYRYDPVDSKFTGTVYSTNIS